jgi:hypothetical protein
MNSDNRLGLQCAILLVNYCARLEEEISRAHSVNNTFSYEVAVHRYIRCSGRVIPMPDNPTSAAYLTATIDESLADRSRVYATLQIPRRSFYICDKSAQIIWVTGIFSVCLSSIERIFKQDILRGNRRLFIVYRGQNGSWMKVLEQLPRRHNDSEKKCKECNYTNNRNYDQLFERRISIPVISLAAHASRVSPQTVGREIFHSLVRAKYCPATASALLKLFRLRYLSQIKLGMNYPVLAQSISHAAIDGNVAQPAQ